MSLKLSNEDVVVIRWMYDQKLKTQREIAEEFKISQAWVSYIVRRLKRNSLRVDLLAVRMAEGLSDDDGT